MNPKTKYAGRSLDTSVVSFLSWSTGEEFEYESLYILCLTIDELSRINNKEPDSLYESSHLLWAASELKSNENKTKTSPADCWPATLPMVSIKTLKLIKTLFFLTKAFEKAKIMMFSSSKSVKFLFVCVEIYCQYTANTILCYRVIYANILPIRANRNLKPWNSEILEFSIKKFGSTRLILVVKLNYQFEFQLDCDREKLRNPRFSS